MIANPPLAADPGDTAWMLVSSVLVLLMMLPGLALFYGGLVRAKNLLSVMTQMLGIAAAVILTWVALGYSLAFSGGGAWIGDAGKAMLAGVTPTSLAPTFTPGRGIPELLFVAFQMMFAAITVGILVGALVERVRFSAMMLLAPLWTLLVYAPLAHMVWSPGGLIMTLGALDFAGGTVVHVNAGVAGLVGALVAGPRLGHLKEAMPPHSLALTLVGAGLLWAGWFGFNGGSALEANGAAALAMINSFIAPAAGALAWLAAERIASGRPSALGGASGAIAGLVAITPACGTSGFAGAALLGAAGAIACYLFVARLKNRLKLDDSLDAFGIHGVAGIVGSVGTAIVSAPALGGFGAAGYALGHQLAVQVEAVAIAVTWSGVGSAMLFLAIRAAIGLRHGRDEEREGLDLTDHGERAYSV